MTGLDQLEVLARELEAAWQERTTEGVLTLRLERARAALRAAVDHSAILDLIARARRGEELERAGKTLTDALDRRIPDWEAAVTGESAPEPENGVGYVLTASFTGPPRHFESLYFRSEDADRFVAKRHNEDTKASNPLRVAALVLLPEEA